MSVLKLVCVLNVSIENHMMNGKLEKLGFFKELKNGKLKKKDRGFQPSVPIAGFAAVISGSTIIT